MVKLESSDIKCQYLIYGHVITVITHCDKKLYNYNKTFSNGFYGIYMTFTVLYGYKEIKTQR